VRRRHNTPRYDPIVVVADDMQPHMEYVAPNLDGSEPEVAEREPLRRVIPRSASPLAPSVRRRRAQGLNNVPPPPVRRVRITDPTQLVSLAPSGRRFHASTCSFVQNREPILLELHRAMQRGLVPCRACNIAVNS
jgi:hypothetical protein